MSKVEQIEQEIRALPREELSTLRRWFQEYDAEAWDREIEADVASGKLDALAEKALKAHRAKKTTAL
ncbi:MAG: hypothetical protein AB1405_16665 [Bdellovibrionota bacterium]